MTHFPYVGSGPYCYANAFAMMFGEQAPATSVIEFATCSAFGMQLIGELPFFDPYGWTPEAGFDDALAAMGWRSSTTQGGDADEALARLKAALAYGPVWIGPVEMGHLSHQPGMKGPIGADHYVVVLDVDETSVLMHDPQGYPYASLPLVDFISAWRAETVGYGSPYTMRTSFERVRVVREEEIILASLPSATRWLAMSARSAAMGTLGNGEAAERLAELIERDGDSELRQHLLHFAVRVGARRADDAARCLARIGHGGASAVMAEQARLIGSLQHPLATRNPAPAAAALRELAPTYDRLRVALGQG